MESFSVLHIIKCVKHGRSKDDIVTHVCILFLFFQEAFKAVEDIHGLFALSKKPPKPQLMANYYNKVSTVFWKSGNALFHACTLHRLYHLSREMRKNLTQDEMQRYLIHFLLLVHKFCSGSDQMVNNAYF